MRNYNTLIGRYPGADGMKTGFICASGFNLVARASRNGKRLIAVVLGSPSSPVRAAKAAGLLERGFSGNMLSWLSPSLGNGGVIQPVSAAPPDLRDAMCGPHRKRPAAEEADDSPVAAAPGTQEPGSPIGFALSSLPPGQAKPSSLLGPVVAANAVVVFVGRGEEIAAENQFARAAQGQARQGRKERPTWPHRPHLPGAQVAAAAPGAAPAQDAFGPLPTQFTQTPRRQPAAAGPATPSWMSFAPTAQAATAPQPLTAAPAPQTVSVPMPRPRPRHSRHQAAPSATDRCW